MSWSGVGLAKGWNQAIWVVGAVVPWRWAEAEIFVPPRRFRFSNWRSLCHGAVVRLKTEELLYHLLWTCEALSRPTFRNLTESFEGWAYRRGLLGELADLERRQLIESIRDPGARRGRGPSVVRPTELGRKVALGGRDPDECWGRDWDKWWHMVIYDVPNARTSARNRLRRQLQRSGFGYLQNSTWVTPDAFDPGALEVSAGGVEVVALFRGQPEGGKTDADVVAGAWDFESINEGYREYLKVLRECPEGQIDCVTTARRYQAWGRRERAAWDEAVSTDPLLPEVLLPSGYLGRAAWSERKRVCGNVAERLRQFLPSVHRRGGSRRRGGQSGALGESSTLRPENLLV